MLENFRLFIFTLERWTSLEDSPSQEGVLRVVSLRSEQTERVVKQFLSLAHARREEAHFWNLRCVKLRFVPLSQVTGEKIQVPGE